jgi:PAS domain S-box-containing protein
MLAPSSAILACALYVLFILAIALWVERKAAAGKDVGNNAVIYAFSFSIYHTAWTYYGSAGKAATSGLLFLPFYIGPTLAMLLWWILLRKLVRIKNAYMITSLADFVSLRYGKSAAIAAVVTVIGVFNLVPYFAIQFRAITASFRIVSSTHGSPPLEHVGPVFAAVIILFTIVLGVRRLVPTERHQGMVVALTAGSLVKLAAFLAVGLFVTYGLFDGFGDIFSRFQQSAFAPRLTAVQSTPSFYISWLSFLLLAMTTLLFLPWQFHLGVIENFDENHIPTAMWLMPLYMLLFSLFVLPIGMAGLLTGQPVQQADNFVLLLPLTYGRSFLPAFAFVGGFSAAIGMMVTASVTVSTMVTNHLLLPVIESLRPLAPLKRYLLQCRWLCVLILVLVGYWFEGIVGNYLVLVDIGAISSVATLQTAPAIIGALFWKRGNTSGALLGMTSGVLIWFYTLLIPSFVQGGFLSRAIVERGPGGIALLRPEHLLGVDGLDPISHAVIWSLLVNVTLYILGSLCFRQDEQETAVAAEIVDALAATPAPEVTSGEETIDLTAKKLEIAALYDNYFHPAKSAAMIGECLGDLKLDGRAKITIAELAEFYHEAEIRLASSIGAAAAHKALVKSAIISSAEEKKLKRHYAEMIAELKMPPSELKTRIDYHREKEKLLTVQAAELEEKIAELDREIAERRKAEEALRNSERRLAEIIDFLPDTTFVVDAHGRIIIWNRAAEEFTGAKAEELLGKGDQAYAIPFYGEKRPLLLDLVLRSAPEEEIRRLYQHCEIKGGIVIGETATLSAKRGCAYTLVMAAPLYDSEGNVTGVIESVRDITERQHAEEELKKHRANLEELVRERTSELVVAKERAEVASQAKSSFLSSMSHELRTPLNAILGYAQILKRHENLTEQQRQQLEIIRGSGEHLLSMINDILDMGKIEAQKMELEEMSFDLSALLRQVLNISRIRAEEKSLAFVYEESTPLPGCVRGDQRKLKQILLNLLSNAVKYTHHGSVTTRVSHDRQRGAFRCEVIDTGIGIAAEQLANVFEPFTQLVETGVVREGAGLGLAITKRLVGLMQGRLEVGSEPGRGSTFAVELPLPAVADRAVCSEVAAPVVTGYHGARRSVLVVDDNPANASMLVSLLEPLGFRLVTAGNGREALLLAVERRPDLVLIDLVMPELDGLDAVNEMRRHPELSGTRIIGTSATVSESPRKNAFAVACDDFLTKPIAIDLLLEKIAAELGIVWQTEVAAGAAPAGGEPGEELEAPPAAELEELHELALMGDMQGIGRWATLLEERAPRYAPFAGELRDLSARFKARAILALVERHMGDEHES